MYQKILLAIDDTEPSTAAIAHAAALAKASGAAVRILHVVDRLDYSLGFEPLAMYRDDMLLALRRAGRILLRRTRKCLERAGVAAEWHIEECHERRVAPTILKHAAQWGAELIVMGTHGRRGIDHLLLGSEAVYVMRRTPIPLFLAKPGSADLAMSEVAPRPEWIVAALDGSPSSTKTLRAAIQLAKTFSAPVRVLHVLELPSMIYTSPLFDGAALHQMLADTAKDVVDEAYRLLESAGVASEARVIDSGMPGEPVVRQLVQEAQALPHCIAVLGTHGHRGWTEAMLGSVPERFVRLAQLPVLLVPADRHEAAQPRTIAQTAPTDTPPASPATAATTRGVLLGG